MQKYLTQFALLIAFATTYAQTVFGGVQDEKHLLLTAEEQTPQDITNAYLINADFEVDEPVNDRVYTYDKDMPDDGIGANGKSYFGQQAVTGWTATALSNNIREVDREDGANSRAGGIFAYYNQNEVPGLGGNYYAPVPNDGNSTRGLGMVAVWGAEIKYTQPITLPAGAYMIVQKYYNAAGSSAVQASNFGYITNTGENYFSTTLSYPVDSKWHTDTVFVFTKEETSGIISLGYKSGSYGSGSAPHLFIDNIKLYSIDPTPFVSEDIVNAKKELLELINLGERLGLDVSEARVVYEDPNATLETVQETIEYQKTIFAAINLSDSLITNSQFVVDDAILEGDGITSYDYDMSDPNGSNGRAVSHYGMQPVEGWSASNPNENAHASGIFTIGSNAFLGSSNFLPPAEMSNGSTEGNVLGLLSVWASTSQYTQNVTIPAGKYTLFISYYNAGGTGEIRKNLMGFIADNGDEYLSEKTTFAVGEWQTETIKFELDVETTGYFTMGYTAASAGSGSMPHLFMEGLSLYAGNNTTLDDLDPLPYAVLSDNNTVLTFYYDDQKENRGGMSVGPFSYDSYPSWHNQRETLTTIVFDTSFANCSSLTSTAYWFNELSKLTAITGIENLKTDNVTEMFYMFNECFSLANLDVSNFKTDNVTDMSFMFRCCSGLTSLDVSNFKTDNVTHMNGMFDGCSSLTSLDVRGFKTDNVASMTFMFGDCSSLTSLDVSNFKTDNVTDMSGLGGMFFGCSGLTSLDVSNFKTDNVTDMSWMFYGCSSLTSLDVSNFKTAYVEDMRYMFFGCSSLTSLDVSNFKTDMVTHMNSMFEGCSELKTIYAGNGWSTKAVADGGGMFTGCTKLVGGAGTIYDANHTDATYAKIDGGTSNPGYFTGVNAIASFVTNGMAFKVTNQAAEKTVTYVQGPSVEHLIIPSSVTYDGQTYAVTAIADSAFAGQQQLKSVKIPSSVKAAGKSLFAGSPHVAAIIWEAPIKMTQEMAGSVASNPNLLFYTSDTAYAPNGVTNVINSQTKQAERIVLSDGDSNDFYCPEEFSAGSISYTHAYQLFTVTGQCQGWESLVLPFDVAEIKHETKGVITPFGALQVGHEFDNGTKPFWLYEYTTGGRFAEADGIKANVPYILSMPNEAKLLDEYILAGNVTFKGTNATVKATSGAKAVQSGNYSFTPNYQNGTSGSIYLLNVDKNFYSSPKGSVFVRNDHLERQARPFEAYFRLDGSTGVKSFINIFDELTDGIRSMEPAKRNANVEYYQLDGTKRSNLQRGFNIIRTKDKVQKLLVR